MTQYSEDITKYQIIE